MGISKRLIEQSVECCEECGNPISIDGCEGMGRHWCAPCWEMFEAEYNEYLDT